MKYQSIQGVSSSLATVLWFFKILSDELVVVSSRGCVVTLCVILIETSCDVTGMAVVDWVGAADVEVGQCRWHFEILLL